VAGVVDDGDGRVQGISHREIAERDQRDVSAPSRVQGRDHAKGGPGGGTEDGRGRPAAVYHGGRRPRVVLAGRGVTADQLVVGLDAVMGEGVAVAAQPGGRCRYGGGVTDEGDGPVTV